MMKEESNENDFDLETCFEKAFQSENCYQEKGEGYYDGYSHFSIHEEMLKDRVRTCTYEKALMECPELLKDKIVLDVGCGTGILSIFAARAGAKHVYAVDNANIVKQARQIIEKNGYSEQITVIQGKIEEVELPVEQVDVIVSEWMGYCLLYESMLDSVLFARDKWLSTSGQLLPDRCAMFLASLEDSEYKEEKVHFWQSVYGVDMSSVQKHVMLEPLVDTFDSAQINSQVCCIFDVNLKTVKLSQLQFSSEYKLEMKRKDTVHALTCWFDVYFSFTKGGPLTLSTSPFNTPTHWKQVVMYIDKPLPVFKADTLTGSIAIKKNALYPRHLDIKVSYHLDNSLLSYHAHQYYKLQ